MASVPSWRAAAPVRLADDDVASRPDGRHESRTSVPSRSSQTNVAPRQSATSQDSGSSGNSRPSDSTTSINAPRPASATRSRAVATKPG